MRAKQAIVLGVGGLALVGMVASAFAVCLPAPLAQSTTEQSLSACLVEFPLESFRLREEFTQTIELKKGQGYWFTASGCPRMGTIGLTVLNGQGKVMKQATGSQPALCFTAPSTGAYTVKIKALSLRGANDSGNIATCFAESRCNTKR